MMAQEPTSAPLAISLFGPFSVLVNGAPLPRLRWRKQEVLLALLTLRHHRPVERGWLAGLLWPEASESQGLATLRRYLTGLRRALGPAAPRLHAPTPATLSLDLTGATVDLIAFDEALDRGGTAERPEVVREVLGAAVSLYRGPLLEGWTDDWVAEERSRREQAYLQALERLAIDALEREDPGAAEPHLRQVIAVDPLRESAQRALMRSLASRGNSTAATQVYQELRRGLHRELNAEPDAETTALFQQLREEARGKAVLGAPRSAPGGKEGMLCAGGPATAPAERRAPSAERGSAATLTFLLTDIEGSTKLWLQHPDAMRGALPRHDALAAALFAQHQGFLVKQRGEGDSLFAVFSRAIDAVAASLDLQRAFLAETWPADTPLRVRVALHTGDAELRDEDYYGPAVDHAARLRAAGHGGQILLSQTTAALVRDHLPEGAGLRELGAHRLKDLQRPEPIFQLAHPELPGEFPPLKSLEAFAHNLPVQLTRFIGREQAMAEVQRLLPTCHLLTLTGAGGCGKTRLALQVAAERVEAYADGVWLVELAALADPALVPQSVAAALGVREEPGRSLVEALSGYLRSRSLLLLLDNCEHLLSACAGLADRLLRACPTLRILATSREPLGVAGEQSYLVPSLSVPEPGLSSVERLREFEAVQLFTDRAVLCQPTFSVTSANAASVVEVCQRLGGIPLAIELAAARVKLLPVDQIAARLDDRFRLLTGGSRTALPRQQTLRALVDWSYDLLPEGERALLRRLSVFSGGWSLEAAEGICADPVVSSQLPVVSEGGPSSPLPTAYCLLPTDEILDLLGRLVDKSLVLAEEQEGASRYHLLETIRQYGAEKLQRSGEEAVWRGRHRDYFLALAEQAKPELKGRRQGEWLARLEGEHDNLRAALAWCTEQGDGEAGLRLGGALSSFWQVRGYLTEGREGLTTLLSLPGAEARTVVRGRALNAAGVLAHRQGAYEAARALGEESLALNRELGDQRGIAHALGDLGNVARDQGEYEAARALFEESLALNRELGNPRGIAWLLYNLGALAREQGDYEAARALLEEGLAIFRELGDHRGSAWSHRDLGHVAREQGDYEAARALLEESLAIFRELGDQRGTSYALSALGDVAHRQGDYEAARALGEESLAISRELGDQEGIAWSLGALGHVAREAGEYARCAAYYRESMALRQSRGDRFAIAQGLEDFAGLAGRQRQWERAVRLLGAAEGVAQSLGRSLPVALAKEYQRTVDGARSALGEAGFASGWAAGRALSLEEAIRFALEGPASSGHGQ